MNAVSTFRQDLAALINRHSMENGSNTPDHILAEYLGRQLEVFDAVVAERDKWYGITPMPGWRGTVTNVVDHGLRVDPRIGRQASGLDEFSSAHRVTATRIEDGATIDGVLPAATTERCPGSGRYVGSRENAMNEVRCGTCAQVVEVGVLIGAGRITVAEHYRPVN